MADILTQFAATAALAAEVVRMDDEGKFDAIGRWLGQTLREVLDAVSD